MYFLIFQTLKINYHSHSGRRPDSGHTSTRLFVNDLSEYAKCNALTKGINTRYERNREKST